MQKIDKLNKQILVILEKSEHPLTTRDIALKSKGAWHSVLTRCLRLQLEGKIRGFKAGNMHLWVII